MAGNKQSGETLRQTMIKKYGSEEAWGEFMRENGRKGGKLGKTGGFAYMKAHGMEDKIREAGAKGGGISRRKVKD